MVQKVEQDIRKNVSSQERLLPEGPLELVPANVPTAVPTTPIPEAPGVYARVFDVQLWIGVQLVVVSDAATSTGKTVSLRPWYYFDSLYDGTDDGTDEGHWVPGEVLTDIPLDSSGVATQIKNLEVANADKFYVQVLGVSGGAVPDWVNVYVFGLVPRKFAVPGLAVLFGETVDGGGGGTSDLTIQDEGINVKVGTTILNFVGEGVLAAADPFNSAKVNVYIPSLEFSPYLGTGDGDLNWPATNNGYVCRPETAEGDPYFTNGWANNVGTRPRMKTVAAFSTGLGITHTSPRVTDLNVGSLTVVLTDGDGNTETATLALSPTGGDQDTTSTAGNIAVHVRDTVYVGPVVEGKVYIWCDIPGFLGENSTGNGGYFHLSVTHTGAPSSADFGNVFWDNGQVPSSSSIPTISVVSPVYKWLSGVNYFAGNSTFEIEDSYPDGVDNVVNMTIDADKDIILVNASQLNTTVGEVDFDSANIYGLSDGVGVSPIRDESPSYKQTVTVGAGNYRTTNARVTTTWHNYHGNEVGGAKTSASANLSIDTWVVTATTQVEYFDDEAYRLQDEDYRTGLITTFEDALGDYRDWVGTGGGTDLRDWDSTENIDIGTVGHVEGAQVGDGVLKYPTRDYSSSRTPVGPNYSGLSGDRFYYRAFYVGNTLLHKNFELALNVTGFLTSDINIGGGADDSTDLRIDIKFPGPNKDPMDGSNSSSVPGSGWLHCGKDFNYPDFKGTDGDGCMTGIAQVGSTITVSLTTKNLNSEYCDGILIVRVRMKDSVGSSKYINSISMSGL